MLGPNQGLPNTHHRTLRIIVTRITQDPFRLVVPEDRVHPGFRNLREGVAHSPAKAAVREAIAQFDDVDGNFLEQFQSGGFNTRLWELYLNTYLLDAYFTLDRTHARPDFVATKAPHVVSIEATTCNPTQGLAPLGNPPRSKSLREQVDERAANYLPMKLGSSLYAKYCEEYWTLEHVAGRPFLLALMDYHELSAERFTLAETSVGLSSYLYGLQQHWYQDETGNLVIESKPVDRHRYGEKEIPSGFFALPKAEHISGVIYSNSATITKFNRMGYLAGHAADQLEMTRIGVCMDPDPNAADPREFCYEVGDPNFPESWGQGLDVFHNPNALHAVDPALFPDSASHRFDGDQPRSKIPNFHPLVSATIIRVASESREA